MVPRGQLLPTGQAVSQTEVQVLQSVWEDQKEKPHLSAKEPGGGVQRWGTALGQPLGAHTPSGSSFHESVWASSFS